MAGEIVGRDEELRSLHEFLDRAGDGPVALVLEGEAGIGKSTLWLGALGAARERGLRVLSARPAEAERDLALAGIGDLLEETLDEVRPALSAPRLHALEVALLVEEATEAVDPRVLGVAVRSALEVLSADGPILLAIDDVQWLDLSSAGAISFALRRLDAPILVLVARRVVKGVGPSELERALAADRVERVRVGPLSPGALQWLLQVRLGRVFARPTLFRIHETSGGNPFYALELAAALGLDVDPMQPLPVPETLEGLVHARLAGLPDATREALVLASALAKPSRNVLTAAGVEQAALEPALAARVIEDAGEAIRFAHPLLASTLYQGLTDDERRRVHGRLAEVVADPLERVRHRALATEGRDAEIAAALEEAADLASARGAMVAAAELGEHALRLTPAVDRDGWLRRTIAAGRAHMAAGEADRARSLGRALEAQSPDGGRAEALVFLSELESGDMLERIALRREALRDTSAPLGLQLRIHQRLALETRFTEGLTSAQEHARIAVELAVQLDDEASRAGALAAFAMLRFTAGEPDALRLAEQAHDLAVATGDPERFVETGFCLAHVLVWSIELRKARGLLESLHQHGSERDERVSAQALWYLSLIELRTGRLAPADECAERARELSVQYGRDETEDPQNLFPIALVAAHRGELDAARGVAERGRRLAESRGALLPGFRAALGIIDAWGGDAEPAVEHFAAAEQTADEAGWAEPGLRWWRADYAEALLERGRTEDAVALLTDWETAAARLGREWVLAQVVRCRGLAAAARADVDQALLVLEEAVVKHEAVGDPFGRARALLAFGAVRRRARMKRTARETIEEALAGFEECGAAGWAERARAELGRIGGRTRTEGLTAAERRVAALVAEGRTNREVAAALVLGERTVEAHLTHIYAKLGVRSRTELARVFRSVS